MFHYSQAVQRNVAQNGLERVYRGMPPFAGPDFAVVHKYIRRLIGLALLPPDKHRVVWNQCLNTPPLTGNPLVDANLTVFRDYFLAQWLPNREKLLLWNHFDRDGPRTTNNAEGYHSGLRSAFDGRRLAPFGVFMVKLQQFHHEICSRVKLLQQSKKAEVH